MAVTATRNLQASSKPEATTAPTLDFTRSDKRIDELLSLLNEIADLRALMALSEWDQNTSLPNGAGEIRGMQMATLQGLMHERETNPRIGKLLGELEGAVSDKRYSDADRGLVRQASRNYSHATKLPRALVEEMARVGSASFEAWRTARATNDFALFAPWLTKTIALQREVADRFGYQETRYDALLDIYEPGMTSKRLDSLFATVRKVSVKLLQRIQTLGTPMNTSCLEGKFSAAKQDQFCIKILEHMGYDFERGEMKRSPHPFTTDMGSPFDVRVTIRPIENLMQAALMAAIHEGGHALYEQGSPAEFARTPVAGGASMGAHESQSRLWENAIGRSEAFWLGQFNVVRRVLGKRFASVEPSEFARALNAVEPSLIRVEADEVTYNLHIIIRFELEKQMVNGEVDVNSLPRLWNEKYQEYLGITPPTDTDGILQDIHWTSGFGYFPTYTLGNLYAAQMYETLRKVFPDFDERLAKGDTGFILAWLREHMHRFASVYLPEDLITRMTGSAPSPTYFERYLTRKFSALYHLPPEK